MSFRKVKNLLGKHQSYMGYTKRLYLTEEQRRYLNRAVELYRYVYNWTLDTKESYYQEHKNCEKKHLKDTEIQKKLSELRNEKDWLQEVPLGTLRNAMFDALTAYELWIKGFNGKPKHKSKKRSEITFSPRADRCYFEGSMFKIEGLDEKVETKWYSGWTKQDKDHLRYANIRVFRDSLGMWKVSFSVILPKVVSTNYDNLYDIYTPSYPRAIGIDLNKINLIVTSYLNGEIYKLPESILKKWEKYKELSKEIQRDIKLTFRRHPEIYNLEDYDLSDYKSNNAKKRQIKRNKVRTSIVNIINTYAHTIAKKIVTRYPKAIVMENLPIREMYKYHTQAKGISYIPFYGIRKIFENKCNKYNIPFILARRDYPSTQRCSNCGSLKKMDGKHTYICPVCGNVMDRDINAAFNLEQLAYVQDALEWVA